MINLNTILNRIECEIENSILKFIEENGIPKTLGIYCCPWSGWLTTNFNLSEDEQNCPDFEFADFNFIELPELEEEYQNDNPVFKIGDNSINLDIEALGDEAINEFIFNSLKPIATKIKENKRLEVVLQMLDSQYVEMIQ